MARREFRAERKRDGRGAVRNEEHPKKNSLLVVVREIKVDRIGESGWPADRGKAHAEWACYFMMYM